MPGSSCAICSGSAFFYSDVPDLTKWQCERCGDFAVTGSALTLLRGDGKLRRHILSGWIREQNDAGIAPKISSEALERIRHFPDPAFKERLERFLIAAVNLCPNLETTFQPGHPSIIGASFCETNKEAAIMAEHLHKEGFLEVRRGQGWRVTPRGRIACDELRSQRTASTQGFVAMWFHEDLADAYEEGFEPGIRKARYSPFRIDRKEHTNKIDDEIIAEIRRSAFLVADFTGHRGGVYFEAGFAMGLNMPVIWTCRKDAIADLHFDIRQYNCIDWTEFDELSERITNRIKARLGEGPVV